MCKNSRSTTANQKQENTNAGVAPHVASRISPEGFINSRTGELRSHKLYDVADDLWLCKFQMSRLFRTKARYMYLDSVSEIARIVLCGGMYADFDIIDDGCDVHRKVYGCLHVEHKGVWNGYPVVKIGGLAVLGSKMIDALCRTLLLPELRGAVKLFATWGTQSSGLLARALATLRTRPDLGIPLVTSTSELDGELVDVYARRQDGSRKTFDARDLTVILPPSLPKQLWPKPVLEKPKEHQNLIRYLARERLTPQDEWNIQRWLQNVERADRLLAGISWDMPHPIAIGEER